MNSFICWVGGKKLLRKSIIDNFPEGTDRYIEVFGGAGWVLFGKEPHKLEVFNDIDGELINLYRCVKYHPDALQKELDFMLMSREQFFDQRERNLRGLTDIQRAARYFYIIKSSFGGKKTSFGTGKRNIYNATAYLMQVTSRLKNVVIENEDFTRIIKTYDRPTALFYCDPPYYGAEKNYNAKFGVEEHIKLRDILTDIKGKFLLSYNDCEYIRELYKDFEIVEIERANNLKTKSGVDEKYKELIIKNY
ncbi:MAG: DNA adenine methylase [Eubacterium sp.]|nr:DNA adenine methylase [Eubacterium sp.]